MKLTHLDLFSGIGGASYALDQVYGKENIEHIFCEIDPFCQAVLQKHWPEAKIYGDIRTITANAHYGKQQEQQERGAIEGGETPEPRDSTWACPSAGDRRRGGAKGVREQRTDTPFLLTGGFPCQPFSQAGRRKGTEDDRHLWPEMFRVIREFRPRWVVGENVAGLLTIEHGMVFKQVLADLESEGYEVECFVIPAVAVNAPHRRDRIWIVANRESGRERRSEWEGGPLGEPQAEIGNRNSTNTHAKNERLERGIGNRPHTTNARLGQSSGNPYWSQNWLEVATRLCRVDDGLPARMDGTTISASRHRKERLKGLGNAWVPQVAMEIFRGIKEIEQ